MQRHDMRTFDPVVVGSAECDAWVAYYRHEWLALLRSALVMVGEGFGLGRRDTVRAAYLVLRANQVWAPYPDNDPDAARAYMARFYRVVADAAGAPIDPVEAARREVDWWAIHRELQHERAGEDDEALVAALAHLYGYVYGLPEQRMREAARHRALAMRLSDTWVRAGCDPSSDLVVAERLDLVASFSALRREVTAG